VALTESDTAFAKWYYAEFSEKEVAENATPYRSAFEAGRMFEAMKHKDGVERVFKWYTDTRPYQPPEAQADLLDQLFAGIARVIGE
jgi:hypothetical protein